MSHIKNICLKFQNYSRDELKKIDEQTGGLKGKESSRKLSNEEKQIQVASLTHLISLYPYADIEREGGALERTVEEGKSSKRGREREEERGRTRSEQKPQLLEDIIIILELKQQWQ